MDKHTRRIPRRALGLISGNLMRHMRAKHAFVVDDACIVCRQHIDALNRIGNQPGYVWRDISFSDLPFAWWQREVQ